MSRKDYALIAKLLLNFRVDHTMDDQVRDNAFVRDLVVPLSKALAEDNDRFVHDRFLKAVGVDKRPE